MGDITNNWGYDPEAKVLRIFVGDFAGFYCYPLVNIQKTDGKIHHAINGKTHHKWAMFNSYVINYQRVFCYTFAGFCTPNFKNIAARASQNGFC